MCSLNPGSRFLKSSQESCLKSGAPLKLREKNSDAVKVLAGIQEIDRVIKLARQVERRYGEGERSEINNIITKIVENMDTQKQYCQMVSSSKLTSVLHQ